MENKNDTKHADLPSNYVTLAQLQERWIKEQQRKLKEKEQQEEHDHNKLRNTESEPGHLSLSVPVSAPLPSTRRSSNGKSHRWNLVGTSVEKWKAVSVSVLEENVNEKKNERKEKKKGEAGAQAEEGEVTGNLVGKNVEEPKAVSVAILEENLNKRKEMRTKQNSKSWKGKAKGEARAQEEEGEVTGNLISTEIEELKAVSVAVLEENVNEKRKEMRTKKKSWKGKGKKKGEARAQEEAGEVAGNLIGTEIEELKAVAVAVLEENVNERTVEMQTKKKSKSRKGKKKGEARAQEEEGEVAGSGSQALQVKSEKKNAGWERRREMRAVYREKVEKVVEENNHTVEIEKEIGDPSVARESEKSKRPNKVINGRECNGHASRGLSTLFQTLFGTRLPSVAVGSYAYMIPTTSIVLASRHTSCLDNSVRFVQTMRAIQGALIIAGCFQIIMGFLGLWRNTVRFLSPVSIVPCVTFAGLGLYYLGFPTLAKCVEIGLPGILIMVFFSQYLPRYVQSKRPICDRFAVLFSAAIAWLFAQILTASTVYNEKSEITQMTCRTDRAGLIYASPWMYIPYPFQWGSPTFKAGEVLAMMAASFVSLFESTGTFYATSRYGSATPVPPSVVSRGIGWLGIGVFLNGIFGCVTGFTASVENAGLLALTKVGSRRVIQISAGFMIFFSLFGKFGAFFASIPLPIIAALYCVLFGYTSSAGLGFLQFCNLNSFRTKFILGFSFFIGISIPQYFREYYQYVHVHARYSWFHDIVTVIFMSHTTVAALVALFLDCTLAQENDETAKDNGLKWWERFSLYSSDVRNDEFYALPCNLNKLFPAL